ncbi:hypothetical protein OsJ_20181 [Oryza sativa Japonica Group]|uniref:SGNH hydrolase-type esterase domain-containing protein n=1 Tax=Oryza sativa subsp. japonica TaxID=39947 RepID=B9FRK7_ORYSJ|nr:hypothetical protein OsJ_20181 [Oryza sativa Japonica Group]
MRPSIVLFGDSITEEAFGEGGWGAHLANHYSGSADVVLRGYSGYNTRWAAMVAAGAVVAGAAGAAAPPAAVTVCFGANDASLPGGGRGVPARPGPRVQGQPSRHLRPPCRRLGPPSSSSSLPRRPSTTPPRVRYTQSLSSCINFIGFLDRRTQCKNGSPMARRRARAGTSTAGDCAGLPERTNESAGAYARACVEVAAECGLRVIDIWSKMQRFPGWESSFLRDGLHLTPRGNRVVFEEVVFALKDASLGLEALPADLPLFCDMDPNNPVKSFDE